MINFFSSVSKSLTYLRSLTTSPIELSIVTVSPTILRKFRTFWAPVASFLKFGIPLDSLIDRVDQVRAKYLPNVPVPVGPLLIFPLTAEGRKAVIGQLRDLGGVYLIYCHTTGFFYIGSTKLFFTKGGQGGRLSQYMSASPGVRMNRNIAADILKYGHADFTVIILSTVMVGDDDVKLAELRVQEQAWILMYPTYNSTFSVLWHAKHNEVHLSTMSTIIYQYSVINGLIDPASVQTHVSIKELCRSGYCLFGSLAIFKINYFDLNSILKGNGLFHQNSVVFSKTPIDHTTWHLSEILPHPYLPTLGLWAYNDKGLNSDYTVSDLIDHYWSPEDCQLANKISKTTLIRARATLSPVRGIRYSNIQLH